MSKIDLDKLEVLKLHKVAYVLGKRAGRVLEQQLEITFPQFMLLSALNFHPDSSQAEIAAARGLTEAAISRLVETVREQGWVEREEKENNRREHVLTLTEKGRQIQEKALKLVEFEYQNLFGILTDAERQNLNTILDKIILNLNKPNYA